MEVLEKTIEFAPAFDKRDPDPKKNYGIHGVEMRWIVKGSKGAVQFLLFTNWHLKHVAEELKSKFGSLSEPMPADLGYHSKVPMYEGQRAMGSVKYNIKEAVARTEALKTGASTKEALAALTPTMEETGTFSPCKYVDDAPCYYDGSGCAADIVFQILVEKGGEAVWEYLENYYKETFENAESSVG